MLVGTARELSVQRGFQIIQNKIKRIVGTT